MEDLFFTVVGMSLTGSAVILFVLLARLALRRAPKIFSYALWAVVLLRLLCPFALDSAFSLLPSAQMVAAAGWGGGADRVVQIQTGIPAVDRPVNDFLVDHPYRQGRPAVVGGSPEEGLAPAVDQLGPVPDWRTVPAAVWLAGTAALLGYSLFSLLNLRRKLVGSVPLEGEKRVRLADHIPSPFVLGVFRPVIYLPSGLAGEERDYILLHERTHIRRCDHVTRALAWLAVAVHWFNPLVWLAFHLAGRDMEMSCDEAVLARMGRDVRADYSTSLLRLSTGGRLPAGPLAFGGGNIRRRIKNVLGYKKPAFWVTAAALILVLGLGFALATDPDGPADAPEPYLDLTFSYSEDGAYVVLAVGEGQVKIG
ncbi:MAG: M56 family metallopeptidase, partial [Oscillospiraceae bacterium]|nr:M56 family metallopeptidase [Oscillospiraceae bacterium]